MILITTEYGLKKETSVKEAKELLEVLCARFERHINRHKKLDWSDIKSRLEASSQKLWSLSQMELTGGEPDVVDYDKKADEYIFYDCSQESPKGRRSVCYDHEALEARKKFKPDDSAKNMAENMGVELLTEEECRYLQSLGEFDLKTSSWINTPEVIRSLGGALFCDRRYNHVFTYHNGADSYYVARGFRASLRV